ncbi:MAG: DNA primase [Bacteroidales bacterium]|nr:DNA primase [Bacteroidales bacterium]
MIIDRDTVQKILDSAQILDVVQDFMSLKRRGTNYIGCCPFHNEKTPSLSVSPAKNIFKCFGCGASGSPVTFVMKHENMTYPEALKYLAKKYNITVQEKEFTAEEKQEHEERESMNIVNQFAQTFFTDQLFNTEEGRNIALTYFQERGFRPDTIEKFQLGYSPTNRQALVNEATKKGYQTKFLVKTGLIIEKEDGYKFDRFTGRVIFPIHGISGKVVAFGGRIMTNDKKQAKYVNSPESEVYHKSQVLYGIYQAKAEIVRKDKCYLCEGYCDVISMHQSGVTNTVASSGTSLTPGQISVIKRFTSNLTVIYDGDPAGIKASLRGIDLILEQDINVKVVLLPEPEDPDSFARSHTPTELQEYIDSHEEDFIRFKTRILLKDAEDPLKKSEVINSIITSISKISNAVTRSVYIKECSRLLDVKEDALYAETGRTLKKSHDDEMKQRYRQGLNSASQTDSETSENQNVTDGVGEGGQALGAIITNPIEIEEREIIKYLVNYGNSEYERITDPVSGVENIVSVATYIVSEMLNDEMDFVNPVYKKIFDDYKTHLFENQPIDTSYFLNNEDEQIRLTASEMVIMKDGISKIWARRGATCNTPDETFKTDIPKSILTYKLKIIQNAEKDALNKLKNKSLPIEEQMQIIGTCKQLKALEQELSKSLKRIVIN